MIKVIDIVYHYHAEYANPKAVLDKHRPAFGFADFINPQLDMQFVKHLNYTGVEKINGMLYAFFKSRNRFWWIPFATHRYIKQQNPDIVIIEGLCFPLQLLFLRSLVGKKCRFIMRHHGEKPFGGIKQLFQKWADKYTNAYLFTSHNNAAAWIHTIIKKPGKCVEVLEASTYFSRKDFLKAKEATGVNGSYNFLWVGRLNQDKDPITVLKAFEKYAKLQQDAILYMIFQENDLLSAIQQMILKSRTLQQSVRLVGRIENHHLADWYSAVNFFIAGSRREAAGYAILEAMACGCIPVVTAIPAFQKITENGKYGFLYPPGDVDGLVTILAKLNEIHIEACRLETEIYFRENLGFKNIADGIFDVCKQLQTI